MPDVTPTRSVALEMKDERRAMHEGYVFLDEKCLLLAAEILRELARYAMLRSTLIATHARAVAALEAAIVRHGLENLQVHPVQRFDESVPLVACTLRGVMGVRLQDARWCAELTSIDPSIDPSPEAEACRAAFLAMATQAPALAAVVGNLERLRVEYRRAVRRARALNDVLLPELDRDVRDVELRLEELEQEDAIAMRSGA